MAAETREDRDEWVRRAVKGDREALDSLLLHFHDPLLDFIRRTIASSEMGGISPEDLSQMSMVAAIRGITGIEPRGADAFFSWLQEIARNSHRNMIKAANAMKRGGGRVQAVPTPVIDTAATSFLNLIAGSDPSPSLVSRRKEAIEALAQAIAGLNPEQRELINLYYISHVPIGELAKRFNISDGAVSTRIHRILNALREQLASRFGQFSSGL